MVTYRTVSNDTCDCAIEEIVDDDGNASLAFFHNVCEAHRTLASSSLSQSELDNKRSEIVTGLQAALDANRTKNLDQYDNHPIIIAKREACETMKFDPNPEIRNQGLLLEAHLDSERQGIIKTLDKHESDAKEKIITSIYANSLAFRGANIHSIIKEENSRKNVALERSLATGPTGLFDTVDGSRQLKDTIFYNYSWTGVAPDRVLTVSFTGINLTNTQKNTIRNAINTRLGTGKVTLV